MSHAITRFRVGHDRTCRLFFVRDTLTGKCRGTYQTAAEAFSVARRANRLGVLAQRHSSSV